MAHLDPDEIAKQARDHAWDWFALHASQRMQTFNFFLVVTAFLFAAYSTLLEKNPATALGVALLGAWLSIWFNRLDSRTRQLIKAGERALAPSEARLSSLVESPDLRILTAVESPERGASSYRRVVNVIQSTMFAVFLLGAAYAAYVIAVSPRGLAL